MAAVNQSLGEVTLRMSDRMDDGALNADDLRSVGEVLRDLGADMVRRADELDPPVRAVEQ
jgi:hypothetical protein